MIPTRPPGDPGRESGRGLLEAPITPGEDSVHAWVTFDDRHQGWRGIPHGGILMSMVLETVHRGLPPPLFSGTSPGPLRVSFRLGGPPLSIGDRVEVGARRQDGMVRGWLKKEGEEAPTLQADIRCGPAARDLGGPDLDRTRAALQRIGNDPGRRSIPLPYSSACFVCGCDRSQPGLARRFFCQEGEEKRIAFTYVGLDPEDRERFEGFALDRRQTHPGVLIAVLDETLGWSGFVETLQGGVTVRLEVDIHRPAEPGEKLLFLGTCTGRRGRTPRRQFWFSEGAILPMGEKEFSPIMTAKGQWLCVPELTQEMKRHLMPPEWLQPWFGPRQA